MRVFISHSSKDAAFIAEHLRPVLERGGMSVWCSSVDAECGVDWERLILRTLQQSDWFLVVLSPDAADSDWVRAEVHWALENRKGRVIPVMVRTCEPSAVHLKLGTLQFIDFRPDPQAAALSCLSALRGDPPDPLAEQGDATLIVALNQASDRQARVLFDLSVGVGEPRELSVDIDRQAILGRAVDVDVPIANSSVSRYHARLAVVLSRDGKRLEITDLQSSNGTYVNEIRIEAPRQLEIGDTIDLGTVRLRLRKVTVQPGSGG